MPNLQNILEKNAKQFVSDAGNVILKEVSGTIVNRQQYRGGEIQDDVPVDASLGAVTDLKKIRKQIKVAASQRGFAYPFPFLPRFATGALAESMRLKRTSVQSEIFVSDPDEEKVVKQQVGSGDEWQDEFKNVAKGTNARPYFGVSTQAMQAIETIADNQSQKLVNDMDGLLLGTITVKL